MEKVQCKTIENYVVDITTKVINGYDKLELVFGNKYEIHYGIHQGIYEYVGKVVENKLYPNDELFTGNICLENVKLVRLLLVITAHIVHLNLQELLEQ